MLRPGRTLWDLGPLQVMFIVCLIRLRQRRDRDSTLMIHLRLLVTCGASDGEANDGGLQLIYIHVYGDLPACHYEHKKVLCCIELLCPIGFVLSVVVGVCIAHSLIGPFHLGLFVCRLKSTRGD